MNVIFRLNIKRREKGKLWNFRENKGHILAVSKKILQFEGN